MSNLVDYIKYFWCGHIVNWPWRSRLKRRNIRNIAFTSMKIDYLKKYIPFIESLKPQSNIPSDLDYKEEKVFTIWLQGMDKAPEVVKKCVYSIKEKFGDRFEVLDENTLFDYINLDPSIIEKWKNGMILPAHFSDIARLELLYRYGGYWFDATDFLTGNVPKEIENSNFFIYITSENLLIHTFVQNYFIRAKKGDPLLKMWRDLVMHYWKHENKAASYYLVQHLFRLLVRYNEEAKKLYEKMPKIELDCTQVIWHKVGNDPYDGAVFEQMCKDSFFQKCTYRKKTGIIRDIIPGSMADYLLNSLHYKNHM